MENIIAGLAKIKTFSLNTEEYKADFKPFEDCDRELRRKFRTQDESKNQQTYEYCSHIVDITLYKENNLHLVVALLVHSDGLNKEIRLGKITSDAHSEGEVLLAKYSEIFDKFFAKAEHVALTEAAVLRDINAFTTNNIAHVGRESFSIEDIDNHTVTIDNIKYEFIKLSEQIDFTDSNNGIKTYATHLILRTPLDEDTSQFYCIVQEVNEDGDDSTGTFYFGHKVTDGVGPITNVTDEVVVHQLYNAFFTAMTYFVAKETDSLKNEPFTTEPASRTPFTVGDIKAAIEGLSDDTHVTVQNFNQIPEGIIPDIDMYRSESSVIPFDDSPIKKLPILVIDLAPLDGSYE